MLGRPPPLELLVALASSPPLAKERVVEAAPPPLLLYLLQQQVLAGLLVGPLPRLPPQFLQSLPWPLLLRLLPLPRREGSAEDCPLGRVCPQQGGERLLQEPQRVFPLSSWAPPT